MIGLNPICGVINKASNQKINIMLVDRDAFHNETEVEVLHDVDALVMTIPVTDRKYREDKRYAEANFLTKTIYIASDPSIEEILKKIRKRDIIEIGEEKYRIIDIGLGYNINGRLEYVELVVA